jgi:DNA topoisomerase-1
MAAAYKDVAGEDFADLDIDIAMDPDKTVQRAGLRYVTDALPGIGRRRAGKGFRYSAPDGTPVRGVATLARIKALVIPPAWKDVWICPSPRGHIQATGRDERGRKQYLYHQDWRAVRDATKYARLPAFGVCLPRIRRQVASDLAQPGLPHDKVMAAIVELLDRTRIRIGNEAYARANKSYGLTTMRQSQVEIDGTRIQFEFRGKSGKHHLVELHDRRLARILKRCEELPGYELFQYLDEQGERHAVDAADVNAYLLQISGEHFTAKDFRTWGGTVAVTTALRTSDPAESETQAAKNITEAIKEAARELGNTPTVCRKSYVHPAILDAYKAGKLPTDDVDGATHAGCPAKSSESHGLDEDERIVLSILTGNDIPQPGKIAGAHSRSARG